MLPDKADCRVYLKTIQGGAIRTLSEVLKEVVHDVLMKFDPAGVQLMQMDSARCALVSMKLRAENFEEYKCTGVTEVGLSLASMFKLLRITGSHDTVTMYITTADSSELGITIQNSEKNSLTDFRLKLLDVDNDEITIPEVEFDSVITMPSVYFQRLCRDAENIADHITIRSEGGVLTLGCDGDFARQETTIGQADSGMAIQCREGSPVVEGKFSLKYLIRFCKASSLCNTLYMYMKQSYPLVMRYNVAGLGELKFALAPEVTGD